MAILMRGLNPIGIAVIVVIAAGSFWAGSALKQAEWTEDKNAALELQVELDAQSDKERRILNEKNLKLQIDLEQAERNTERLSDEIQDAINRASVVKPSPVKTPRGCPVCNIVDTAEHYRLFNCAVRNSCQTVSPTGSTRFGNASLPRAVPASGVDGTSGPDYRNGAF